MDKATAQKIERADTKGARSKSKAPARSGSGARAPAKQAQGEKPAEPKATRTAKPPTRAKALSTTRKLLEEKQRRAKAGPSWPHADPHMHRARETLEEPAAEHAREAAKADEQKNMDPTQRDRRSKHEPRGVS